MKFLKCPKNFAMSRCCLCSCADPVVIAFSFFFFFLSSLSPSACFLQRGTSARLPSLVKLPQAWQEDLTISSGCVACHNFNRPWKGLRRFSLSSELGSCSKKCNTFRITLLCLYIWAAVFFCRSLLGRLYNSAKVISMMVVLVQWRFVTSFSFIFHEIYAVYCATSQFFCTLEFCVLVGYSRKVAHVGIVHATQPHAVQWSWVLNIALF